MSHFCIQQVDMRPLFRNINLLYLLFSPPIVLAFQKRPVYCNAFGEKKNLIDQSNALFLSLSFSSTEARKITAGHETEEIIEFVVGLREIQLFLKAGTEAAGTVT